MVVVGSGCGDRRRAGCGGVVVVGRKPTMWQRLNWHYSIWDAAGCAAAVGNITTLCLYPGVAIVVQLARALCDLSLCSCVQFPKNAFFFFHFITTTIIKYNTIQLK